MTQRIKRRLQGDGAALGSRRTEKGLTLIETCVVVAIIAILAAFLMPVLSASKMRALKADEMSRLRQLSQAAELYEDRTSGWPTGTRELIEAGLVPPEISVSLLDNSPRGWSNEVVHLLSSRSEIYRSRETSYRRSFVGPFEYGKNRQWMKDYIVDASAGGWLVSLAGTKSDDPYRLVVFPEGSYTRLLMSGAAVHRTHRAKATDEGPAWSVKFLFSDDTELEPEK